MKNYINELKLKGFSLKTIKCYTYHIEKFLKVTTKSRESITNQDVKDYLITLINEGYNATDKIKNLKNDLRGIHNNIRDIKKDVDKIMIKYSAI